MDDIEISEAIKEKSNRNRSLQLLFYSHEKGMILPDFPQFDVWSSALSLFAHYMRRGIIP